ncbi:uncharacterized protein LOC119442110 [Dermacentor silvarum]|uniref:uncharacterized protein LOC119442110 n=1 Tax=Dermacentor silvarum TaxID=543639 RepID=UPI001897A727|nr:uncharacterized protein LOC119442110 [Dermacentor silvarum]
MMETSAGNMNDSAKASAKVRTEDTTESRGAGPSTSTVSKPQMVHSCYSPPCTRSQAQRFANQLKCYQQLPGRRSSTQMKKVKDSSKVNDSVNLKQDDVGTPGPKKTSKKKNRQGGKPQGDAATKTTPKKSSAPSSIEDHTGQIAEATQKAEENRDEEGAGDENDS